MPPQFGWGAMLAAAGAGAYAVQNTASTGWDIVRGFARTLGGGSADVASSSGRGTGELQTLQGEIDRLHKLLADVVRQNKGGGGGTMVIHTGPGGRTWLWVPALGVVLTVGYCKLRGWSVLDMFYVSRGSLSEFRDYVATGFTRMWDEMRRQKEAVLQNLKGITTKQEQLNSSQEQMGERLRQVGNSVDDIKDSTNRISNNVRQLEEKVTDMSNVIVNSNHGIMLLCQSFFEITSGLGKQNSRSMQALKSFITGSGGTTAHLGSSNGGAAFSQLLPPTPAVSGLLQPAADSAPRSLSGSSGGLSSAGLAGLAGITGSSVVVQDDTGVSLYRGFEARAM